jgi:hypothetical protein
MDIDYTQETQGFISMLQADIPTAEQEREQRRKLTTIEHLLYGGMVLNAFLYITMLKHKAKTKSQKRK